MKNRKLKTGIQAIIMAGFVVFFTACNNSDYTKNPSSSGTTPATASDTVSNTAATDTASGGSSKKMAKKGKISVGSMTKNSSEMKADKDGVYDVTDVAPAYPGGQTALESYVNDNIQYPQSAIDNNGEGTVSVEFVVDKDGSVMHPMVIGKKSENGLDDAAVKVVSGMQKWTPGKVKGKDVKTRVVLPVTFKLDE